MITSLMHKTRLRYALTRGGVSDNRSRYLDGHLLNVWNDRGLFMSRRDDRLLHKRCIKSGGSLGLRRLRTRVRFFALDSIRRRDFRNVLACQRCFHVGL